MLTQFNLLHLNCKNPKIVRVSLNYEDGSKIMFLSVTSNVSRSKWQSSPNAYALSASPLIP